MKHVLSTSMAAILLGFIKLEIVEDGVIYS